MKAARKNRLFLVLVLIVGVGIAAFLASLAFRENLTFFFTPAQVAAGEVQPGQPFRVGGLVIPGSVERLADGVTVRFQLTDTEGVVTVQYTGVLPDLFKEGQGIVARGTLDGAGTIMADQVLAKHDENYMPPEVAEALQARGAMPDHEMLRKVQP
ncbi:MAG: cytochrome c maturation protein CcmE [Pseudomonadota bacterium]|nr:cytochrome c maturation protein CcmE [Pseudomonadota bacterium]